MKKNKFIISVSAFFSLVGLLFTSCYDNIYSLIEKEVAIDNSGLNGDISNIVRCKDYLFLANGKIYGKPAKTLSEQGKGSWQAIHMPVSGSSEFNVSNRVVWLASDDNFLYSLALYYEEDNNGNNSNEDYARLRKIYVTDLSDNSNLNNFPNLNWEEIELSSPNNSVKIIFDNKARSERNAYASISEKIYKLNGKATPTEQTINDAKIIGETKLSDIITCAKYKGADYFSKYYSLVANDKFIYYTPTYTTGSINYPDSDNILYYTTDPSNESLTKSIDTSFIFSLAITEDHLLCGTTNGLGLIKLNAGKEPEKTVSFSNNGNSVISEHVYMVYSFDETKNLSETDLYAASTIYGPISSSLDSYDNIGLYACPAGGEWNRDGD